MLCVSDGSVISMTIITWTCHACWSSWTIITHGRIGTLASPRYLRPWRSSGKVRSHRSGRWVHINHTFSFFTHFSDTFFLLLNMSVWITYCLLLYKKMFVRRRKLYIYTFVCIRFKSLIFLLLMDRWIFLLSWII